MPIQYYDAYDLAHKYRSWNGERLISETLILLSMISATATVAEKPTMAARFGIAFLGLFSSLAVYLHGLTMTGLVLLITSSILLPCILSVRSSATEIGSKTSHRARMCLIMIGVTTGLWVGVLLNFDLIMIEFIGLASFGLALLLFAESPPRMAFGSVVFSQAIAVAIFYWNSDLRFVFLFETCRLLCFGYLFHMLGRHSVRLLAGS